MKKIININLAGRVIPIEDSAYDSLQRYIESLRRYFAKEEGRDEIINDIESRIAELMDDKVRKGAGAISDEDVQGIIASMGRVEDFEQQDDSADSTQTSYQQASTSQTTHKRTKGRLYRDSSDKILGGVCSGFANYMNVDPAVVRLIFAIITFGGFGLGFLLYILLWIILPSRDLEGYVGKRFFRNPDDKVIAGVAGGLGAYFNQPSWIIRLVFAAPLILNIVFGTLNGVFFAFHRDIFPNLFIGSFTGTFCIAYIILWIVLPVARSPFEKMEMHGEKVDVNRIRQNVQEGMGNIKDRMQSWGEEVKNVGKNMNEKAQEFARTQGADFAADVRQAARPVGRGIGHVIGVLFKAFFIFVAGCIALSLFAVLMVFIFGGVAWWPINNFLWSSSWQKLLAWSTLLFFITVPVIAFITWLIRRVLKVRSKNHYLSWVFGGLWLIGLFSAIAFGISIGHDLKAYERVSTDVAIVQPSNNKLIVRVTEPEIRYSGSAWWIDDDSRGFDISNDTMRYNNVKLHVVRSDDSVYHVLLHKYSAGSGVSDARQRAAQTSFEVVSQDSVLNIGSGLGIGRGSKFRGQGVIVEIQVPVGKKINFDESVSEAYNPWVVRKYNKSYRNRFWRNRYREDWDMDESFNWDANVDYTMSEKGNLVGPEKQKATNDDASDNRLMKKDSLRYIRDKQKRVRDSIDRELKKTERQMDGRNTKDEESNDDSDVTEETTFQQREENAVALTAKRKAISGAPIPMSIPFVPTIF